MRSSRILLIDWATEESSIFQGFWRLRKELSVKQENQERVVPSGKVMGVSRRRE